MINKWKVSIEMKSTFITTILLFILGVIIQNDIVVAGSVIILVILSATVEIIEAIHGTEQHTNTIDKTEGGE